MITALSEYFLFSFLYDSKLIIFELWTKQDISGRRLGLWETFFWQLELYVSISFIFQNQILLPAYIRPATNVHFYLKLIAVFL